MKKNFLASILGAVLIIPGIAFAQTSLPTPPAGQQSAVSQSATDLSSYVGQQIDGRLRASSPASGLNQFVGIEPTYNPTPYTDQSAVVSYPRNPDSWTLKGTPLDFTGVEGFNNVSFRRQGATLITPRHFITADHFKLANGTKVTFFDAQGNPVTRTVVNSVNLSNASGISLNDINVGVLDKDVDSSIAHYPLIDYSTLKSMLVKSNYQPFDIPVVAFNQNRQALVRKMNYIDQLHVYHTAYDSSNPLRAPFSGDIIVGDSDQPTFLVIDGKPILLATHSSSNFGYTLGNFVPEINTAINTLGSNGYSATIYNPSQSFAKYTASFPIPTLMNAVVSTSCLSNTSKSQVTLSWNVPIVINYSIASYNIVADGGTPTVVNSQYLLSAGANRLQYVEDGVSSGNHTYSVQAAYSDNNLSTPVSVQATVPNPCSSLSSSNQNKGQGTGNASVTSTPTPSNSPKIPPASGTGGNSASGNSSSQRQALSGGGGSGGSAGGGGSGGIYYYNGAYSISPSSGNSNQGGSQTQVTGSGGISSNAVIPSTPVFTRNLSLGFSGADVQLLQRILNILGYTVSKSGNGSVGHESLYFGPATKAALIRYQSDNVSSATGVYPTGFFGKATRAAMNGQAISIITHGGAAVQAQPTIKNSVQNISPNLPLNTNTSKTNTMNEATSTNIQVQNSGTQNQTQVQASSTQPEPSKSSGFMDVVGGAAKNVSTGFHNFLHLFGW